MLAKFCNWDATRMFEKVGNAHVKRILLLRRDQEFRKRCEIQVSARDDNRHSLITEEFGVGDDTGQRHS